MPSRLLLVFVAITLLAAFGISPALAQKRGITEKDLFSFVWVGDPQIAPDASSVAFVRVTVNEKKDGYNTAIWTVSPTTGESRQLTAGPRDSSPRWSPDGKFLVFVRVPEKDGRPDSPRVIVLMCHEERDEVFALLQRLGARPVDVATELTELVPRLQERPAR